MANIPQGYTFNTGSTQTLIEAELFAFFHASTVHASTCTEGIFLNSLHAALYYHMHVHMRGIQTHDSPRTNLANKNEYWMLISRHLMTVLSSSKPSVYVMRTRAILRVYIYWVQAPFKGRVNREREDGCKNNPRVGSIQGSTVPVQSTVHVLRVSDHFTYLTIRSLVPDDWGSTVHACIKCASTCIIPYHAQSRQVEYAVQRSAALRWWAATDLASVEST